MRACRVAAACLVLLLAGAQVVAADDAVSDDSHVPPQAPAQPMAQMPQLQMDALMDMHDDPLLASIRLDQLERDLDNGARTSWDMDAWAGKDYDKLWLRSEGERRGDASDARAELFWDHAFATFWNWQLGVRHDFYDAKNKRSVDRNWTAFGVRGTAPYGVELEATAYLGDAAHAGLRLRAEYELMLTQRLVLQPQIEANLYSRADVESNVSAGLSDAQFGLRLRYEVRREVAPYLGITWSHRKNAENFAQPDVFRDGRQWIAGVRVWF